MFCPECGGDAGTAKFCPKCGSDLTPIDEALRQAKPGICTECGTEAGGSNFCPECGNQMPAARQTPRQKRTTPADTGPTRHQRPRAARRAAERRGETMPTTRRSGLSPVWIWVGVAIVAAVVVAGVLSQDRSGGGDGSSAAAQVEADTSGSYSQLVDRANKLYDQGITAFNDGDDASGEQYFRAAAEVYRAAWQKQAGDPNVGTDLAVSLFYSRHHDEAIKQVEAVLKKNPDFQAAHLNKGIFLQTEASETKQNGDAEKADVYLAQAKVAFEKAVSLDPSSEVGKHAAEQLQSL